MRCLTVLVLVALAANPQVGLAQEPGAKSPADSLKCMQARPGFTVELMAHEPVVQSPIAFAWGPDGKFWVVEMGDYPLGVDGKGKPGGRVKILEKSRPGAPYDKATIFLDGLSFPTGVTPYGKGVLITCAPDIFYAEDTDGDGKADKKEILFTGFREGNQQHRVNGLVWGLDNWFYGANGDSGGKVKSLKTGKVVDISGRDFRLKPDTGEFEAATGPTQFGRCRDDWGNWFGNNNSNPLYHFVLEDHYLRRNPFLLPPDPRVPVSVKPGASEVFPISKPQERFNSPQSLNHFTSACSAIIYRDTLFGPAFEGNSFVSEPVHNLIHREVVKPKGVTFTSQRADDEQKSEFLASSDNWFRPTTLATGPDGALWVADMYRHVIEHPEWIPKDWQKKLDLRAGHDKGRIYRIYPKDKTPRAIVRLDKLSVRELAKAIESPNGWTRDTVQQLLIGVQDELERAHAAVRLNSVVELGEPRGRLQALCALDGMGELRPSVITSALQDKHAAVRKNAIRCLEKRDDRFVMAMGTVPIFEETFHNLLKDPDPQVRMQLACTLGTWDTGITGGMLMLMLSEEMSDRYLIAAALSSINPRNAKGLIFLAGRAKNVSPKMIAPLLRFAKEHGRPGDVAMLFLKFPAATKDLSQAERFAGIGDLLDVADPSSGPLADLLRQGESGKQAYEQLRQAYAAARKTVTDSKAPVTDRHPAIRLLGHGLGDDREDHKLLVSLLSPQVPDAVQIGALQGLGRETDPLTARAVIATWKVYSPTVRMQALDTLLTRPLWGRFLADALDSKRISPSEIDTPRRQLLLQHKDQEIRDIAAKVFAKSSSPDRGKLVDEYILTLPGKADAARGAKLFAKTCAVCHKLGEVGQQVGPDLASVADKSVQGLLVAILDPNRAVEARYVNYLAITKDGRTLNGMIASETSTSVTLVGVDGKSQALLRNQIEELTSTGKSMMPEGLEKDLPVQEMADLIAFIRGSGPVPKKASPGNTPQTIRPNPRDFLKPSFQGRTSTVMPVYVAKRLSLVRKDAQPPAAAAAKWSESPSLKPLVARIAVARSNTAVVMGIGLTPG